MKTTTSITIDAEILDLAKNKISGQMSTVINDFLKQYLNVEEINHKRIDIVKEINKYQKLVNTYNMELQMLKAKLQQLDEMEFNKRQEEKEKEQEEHEEIKINFELSKPLTLDEIQFFRGLDKDKDNEFNTNFYNNTFFKQYSEKQYLKRYNKYKNEVDKNGS